MGLTEAITGQKELKPEQVDSALELARIATELTTLTKSISRYAANQINNVLLVETILIPAGGGFQRDFAVPAGYVKLRNLSTNRVTVVAGGLSSAAPGTGVGVSIVPAGETEKINIASAIFSVYGTPGDKVCLQAFSVGTEG